MAIICYDIATLCTCLQILETRGSFIVRDPFIKRLKKIGYRINTVTFETGLGITNHMEMAISLNTDYFFTRAHTNQDKESVEYRIVQIRRYI
jgi:hypothetical protein